MYKNDFNGFATEKEYEAVKDIIVDKIDDYTDAIMVICHTLQNGRKNVEVDVDTKSGHSLRYHMNEGGVFYVNTEGENFPIQECKILVALDDAAWSVFQEVNGNAAKENLKKFLGGYKGYDTLDEAKNVAKLHMNMGVPVCFGPMEAFLRKDGTINFTEDVKVVGSTVKF